MNNAKRRSWIFVPLVAGSVFTLLFSIQGFSESALLGITWLVASALLVGIEIAWGIHLYQRLFTKQDRPLSSLTSYLFTVIVPPAGLGVLLGSLLIGYSWMIDGQWLLKTLMLSVLVAVYFCLSFIYHIGYQSSFIRCSNWLKEQIIPLQHIVAMKKVVWQIHRITCNVQNKQENYYFHLEGNLELEIFQQQLIRYRQMNSGRPTVGRCSD